MTRIRSRLICVLLLCFSSVGRVLKTPVVHLAVAAALLAFLAQACGQQTQPEPNIGAESRSESPSDTPEALPQQDVEEARPSGAATPEVSSPEPEPEPVALTPVPTPGPVLEPPMGVRAFAREALPQPPDRDLFQLAYDLLLPAGHPEVPRVANSEPVSYEAGRIDEFSLVDLDGLVRYRANYELRLVSSNAYWYVEEGTQVSQGDVERAAEEFETRIYPRVTGYFGSEWKPGVDNDPHLTILHGDIRGAGGYFSSSDEYPSAIRPHSNQREMIYINVSYLRFGSERHMSVLAHELNHAVMWNADASEDTWVNEGLAELAVTVAGYGQGSTLRRYLQNPHIPLVHWPLDDSFIGAHYGGASLFMHYLNEHYPPRNEAGLAPLMEVAEDGIEGLEIYLSNEGYEKDFDGVLRDWIVANFLDERQGVLGYGSLDVQVDVSRVLSRPDEIEREIAQYGTHYIELGSRLRNRSVRLSFEGEGSAQLIPAEVGEEGCWWSNTGDSIASSLATSVDLTEGAQATLGYEIWFSIEEDWDYGYLQVSDNGGTRWEVLETPHTSADDPLEVAFGPGYTGESDGWIREDVDLTGFLGGEVMLRFQYVTDDALNDSGLCIRGLSLSVDGTPQHHDWAPAGFLYTDNRLPQEFFVQVIQKGSENRVIELPTEYVAPGVWQGELEVEPYDGLDRTVVAVTAAAPVTRVGTSYSLVVESLEE